MPAVTLDSLDLAALLCSRVCHDVISPVGAIVNGLEVLEDENDASMRDFALDLIRKSSRQASARLQFARLAFGAAGSAGASIDLGDAEQVARGMFQDEKVEIVLDWPPCASAQEQGQAAPESGRHRHQRGAARRRHRRHRDGRRRDGRVRADLQGRAMRAFHRMSRSCWRALRTAEPSTRTASRPIYAGLVARAAAMAVSFSLDGDAVKIVAVPSGAPAEQG